MIIGIDVDGVLADFNDRFIRRVISVTGKHLFPSLPFDIPCWDYPQYYGYTKAEVETVLADIHNDHSFWYALRPYEGVTEALQTLGGWHFRGDDIYFITSRQGVRVKQQTEEWLKGASWTALRAPTVLIVESHSKGEVARALNLDYFIDDKWENCCDVGMESSSTKVYLQDRPWNRNRDIIIGGFVKARVNSFAEFLEEVHSAH